MFSRKSWMDSAGRQCWSPQLLTLYRACAGQLQGHRRRSRYTADSCAAAARPRADTALCPEAGVLLSQPRRAVRSLGKRPSDKQLTFPKKSLAAKDTAPSGGHLLGSGHHCLLGSMHPGHFSHSLVSDSLWPHGLQHARLPCPSPTPGACSNSCPLSRWCHPTIDPLSSPLLPSSIFPSIRVFSNESALHIRWPKYWSFSFSISPSNEYFGLISFRIDWLDLLAVQGTLKSLLQHHSSKASILWLSAFFIVQLSHPYMITGKTIALTRQTVVDKEMSLLFGMLSRFVIAFLLRSKCLFISWLQSPFAVILELKKIKSVTVAIVSLSVCPWSDETKCHDLSFLNVEFKPVFSLSSFTFIKRLFRSSLVSAIRVVSSAYLKLLIFLLAILIPACASSSPTFGMMCSA